MVTSVEAKKVVKRSLADENRPPRAMWRVFREGSPQHQVLEHHLVNCISPDLPPPGESCPFPRYNLSSPDTILGPPYLGAAPEHQSTRAPEHQRTSW